ncbi:hypothetical protein ABG067_001134 [Albugo candida]|uniref:Uncharacterized protein n=1 Tax=Albugo candida TaxID=65357 RepID=A0A024G0E3_9STRA|nr:unnamed protein product [Albugo candida]|eukprot:CCI40013.1 unnamed protein product [Albugo candida]
MEMSLLTQRKIIQTQKNLRDLCVCYAKQRCNSVRASALRFPSSFCSRANIVLIAAETLNQMDSQILHIKGDDTMFSCYGLERTVLAFYSQLPDVEMELFDYTEADKNLETINLELDKLVKDAKTSTRRRR